MTKLLKFILCGCLIMSLSVLGFAPTELAENTRITEAGYTREEVKMGLARYERTGKPNAITEAVLLPASLGIEIPNLDPAKVLNDTPLKEYGGREDFYAELRAHGYDDPNMENMPYWQYEQLSSHWLLDREMAELLAATNPELADRDLSQWTMGMYREFNDQRNRQSIEAYFTAEQLAELNARNIRPEDLQPLLRDYYFQADLILAQSDDALKTALEGWYETKLTLSLGADWRESARIA